MGLEAEPMAVVKYSLDLLNVPNSHLFEVLTSCVRVDVWWVSGRIQLSACSCGESGMNIDTPICWLQSWAALADRVELSSYHRDPEICHLPLYARLRHQLLRRSDHCWFIHSSFSGRSWQPTGCIISRPCSEPAPMLGTRDLKMKKNQSLPWSLSNFNHPN